MLNIGTHIQKLKMLETAKPNELLMELHLNLNQQNNRDNCLDILERLRANETVKTFLSSDALESFAQSNQIVREKHGHLR